MFEDGQWYKSKIRMHHCCSSQLDGAGNQVDCLNVFHAQRVVTRRAATVATSAYAVAVATVATAAVDAGAASAAVAVVSAISAAIAAATAAVNATAMAAATYLLKKTKS